MSNKMYGEQYRNFRLCVDSYDQGVMTGRLCRPGMEDESVPFHSLVQLLVKVESMLDESKYIQSYTAKRTFNALPEAQVISPGGPGAQSGEVATFVIRLLFRQNASWQGSVTWVEGKNEETFRSVLELVLLMDSAMGGCQ